MNNIIYILGSVAVVSLVSFVGVFAVSIKEKGFRHSLTFLISLAIGALLGDAFFHLIPEAFEKTTNPVMVSTLIIAGIITFFILEKLLHWHHHPAEQTSLTEYEEMHKNKKHLGGIILISDGLHNFADGIIIAASFFAGIEIGIATTIAVIIHEIPQEVGDFGVLIYSGYKRTKALLYNFYSALMAVAGAFVIVLLNPAEIILQGIIPFTAGVFIYVASSDLVPELHKSHKIKKTIVETGGIVLGVIAMYFLLFLE